MHTFNMFPSLWQLAWTLINLGLLFVGVGMGIAGALIARSRKRNPWAWGLLAAVCGLLTIWPGVIVLLVLGLGPSNERTKVCPRCAEAVKEAAQVCRYCRHEFSSQA